MISKNILRFVLIITVLITNISCDQISKNIIRQKIDDHEQIGLLNNYLTITKIENTGAFLSVGSNLPQPLKVLLLTILPVLVLAIAIIFMFANKDLSNLTILGVGFIVGGGIGNIYDRILYGSVTDFLHIDFVLFQTGIFNMADVSVLTGMFIVLGELYFKRPDKLIPY